jgi:hypothetical protein
MTQRSRILEGLARVTAVLLGNPGSLSAGAYSSD